jgi:hypothetical protein
MSEHPPAWGIAKANDMVVRPILGRTSRNHAGLPLQRSAQESKAEIRRASDVVKAAMKKLFLAGVAKRLGPFSIHGSDEQIFGVNGQILGRDQSD